MLLIRKGVRSRVRSKPLTFAAGGESAHSIEAICIVILILIEWPED